MIYEVAWDKYLHLKICHEKRYRINDSESCKIQPKAFIYLYMVNNFPEEKRF